MYFIGYHGTSEAAARNILTTGVRREALPSRGQIGPGFYVAHMKGKLPEWGAENATAPARHRMTYFTRMVSCLTGDANNPFIALSAIRTILKVYATRPLQGVKWNQMNEQCLGVVKTVLYDQDGLGINPAEGCKWLQMVVPFEELKYLHVTRDNGLVEHPQNWLTKKHPEESVSPRRLSTSFIKESPF